jgi:hypothetical protein
VHVHVPWLPEHEGVSKRGMQQYKSPPAAVVAAAGDAGSRAARAPTSAAWMHPTSMLAADVTLLPSPAMWCAAAGPVIVPSRAGRDVWVWAGGAQQPASKYCDSRDMW